MMSQDDSGAGRRGGERLLTLTDGIVGIAMTLLVLPLVDLVPQAEEHGLGWLFTEHGSDLLAFALSFLVIYRFWAVHDRTFAGVEGMTPVIRSLNMVWLMGVAFLPFPTALVGHRATTSSAFLYLAALFVVSALTSTMAQLVESGRPAGSGPWRTRALALAWVGTGVIGVCALLGLVSADAGLYGLLALVVVGQLQRRG